jgi:hypothetical protein
MLLYDFKVIVLRKCEMLFLVSFEGLEISTPALFLFVLNSIFIFHVEFFNVWCSGVSFIQSEHF